MDIVLVSIAGIALILAVAMGVMLLKVLRDERQRSDARVALLTAATGPENVEPSLALFDPELNPRRGARPRVEPVSQLFAAPPVESRWKGRMAIAAAIPIVIVIAGYALSPHATPASAVSAQATHQLLPLELLTLRYTQEPNNLTITGLVQNPRSGAAISHVTAVAFLFDANGALLANGRAGLDYSTLEPGTESPFVIKVPVTGTVSRYRVGFRAADGSVIAHVDRRTDGTAASNERSMGNASWVR